MSDSCNMQLALDLQTCRLYVMGERYWLIIGATVRSTVRCILFQLSLVAFSGVDTGDDEEENRKSNLLAPTAGDGVGDDPQETVDYDHGDPGVTAK